MTQPTCPQCRSIDLQLLAGSHLARCRDCRWLVRLQPNGTAQTAFDPFKPKARNRRPVRLMRVADFCDLEDK